MNNSKLMIAVAAAALIAGTSGVLAQQPGGPSVGQTAPKSSGGGQTTGQPAAPGAVHNGAPETKGGKNATRGQWKLLQSSTRNWRWLSIKGPGSFPAPVLLWG
jgi:hypothetical protein